jgi:hypothetical protein
MKDAIKQEDAWEEILDEKIICIWKIPQKLWR